MRSRTLIIGLCAGLAACLAVPAVAADHSSPGHVPTVAADKASPAPAIVYALRAHDAVDAAILTPKTAPACTTASAHEGGHGTGASRTAPGVAAASGMGLASRNGHPNTDGRTYGTAPASMSLAAHVNANPAAGSGVPAARSHRPAAIVAA